MAPAPPPTRQLPPLEQVIAGRYRLHERIGSGGMGFVFVAEVLATGERIALKFLEPDPEGDPSRVPRFIREAKVALEVRHPGATQVLDLGMEGERLFIAFELVGGEDLRELLRREGRLRFGEAREIALQVADVLGFAHARGIVHRDVKPENLRVVREGGQLRVKMLDFGIAHLLHGSGVRLTAEGTLAGTPRYMAPEQVEDRPIDGRIDQYALALTLFEMLTGAFAMNGKNVPQILMHQLHTNVPTLGWVDPQLANDAVDAFIARASAKDPARRFTTMAEFAAALRALDVDERAWPAPVGAPLEPAGQAAPTHDERPKAAPEADASELPTDRGRDAVQRRAPAAVAQPTSELALSAEVLEPAPTLPGVPTRAPVPATVRLAVPDATPLELTTEPARPAVTRRDRPTPQELSHQTLRGELKPPLRPPKPSALPWVVGAVLLVVLGALGAWLVTK